MKFTDRKVRSLKPRAERYEVWEGGGFGLRLRSGRLIWAATSGLIEPFGGVGGQGPCLASGSFVVGPGPGFDPAGGGDSLTLH